MNILKKIVSGVVLLLLINTELPAQKLLWDIDFVGFFDNREYSYEGQQSQTFFGTRLSPEIGIGLDNNRHRIMAGISWIQPMGTKIDESSLQPTVYYRYEAERFKMSFGSFPRTQLIENIPPALQYDSLTYFRPNITGALFQFQNTNAYIEMYIDWRRMQTTQQREAFLVAANGQWKHGLFFTGGHLVMNHLARPKHSPENISVTDDMVINPYVGLDFSGMTFLDSLKIQCGYLLSLERNRGIGVWHKPQGVLAELTMEWKFIGIRDIFYAGENQQPFYPQLGALLNQGDPFFQSKLYNRTDIYFYLFRNRFVNCFGSFNLHITPGKLDFQQQLVVRLNIDQDGWSTRSQRTKNLVKLRNIL